MDRVLSAKCTLSLATDVATCFALGDECPPSLIEELDGVDGLSKTRIEWFIRGAQWQRDEAPILLAMSKSAAEVDVEPEVRQVAPNCWDRAARAEISLRNRTILFAVIVAGLLAMLGLSAAVGTERTVNNERLRQVSE